VNVCTFVHCRQGITSQLTLALSGRPYRPANRHFMRHGPLERVVGLPHRALLSRSAMRVCQPGPVDRHFAMTSLGRRIVMSRRGFAETGRPPFLTVARASISGVASGSSTYSRAFVTCASTRFRSDFSALRKAERLRNLSLCGLTLRSAAALNPGRAPSAASHCWPARSLMRQSRPGVRRLRLGAERPSTRGFQPGVILRG